MLGLMDKIKDRLIRFAHLFNSFGHAVSLCQRPRQVLESQEALVTHNSWAAPAGIYRESRNSAGTPELWSYTEYVPRTLLPCA